MDIIDGCTPSAHTARRVADLFQSDGGVSINRMPGIEADMLRAWFVSDFDADRVIQEHPGVVRLLQQNTGFYSERAQFAQILDTWCEIYIAALRKSSLLYRLETDYAAQNDFLVGDDLSEIHVWSANRLHQWVPLLQGKTVLVCSPFEESILRQYQSGNLKSMFSGGYIPFEYPEFNLVTLNTHNTILGNTPYPHSDWLGSLEDMCASIENLRFDVAVLGCGGYGVPLCERIRAQGRKAFYVGSYCQVMFGIKGRRWENRGNPIGTYFNEHWINPSREETPKNFQNVEGGCYW